MKTLLVDLDGVIVNLLPTWLRLYGENSREWIHLDAIKEYNHENVMTYPGVWWSCLEKALEQAAPVSGSSIFDVMCSQYDTYIVTYAHHAAPNAHRIKLDWLAKYFPDFDRDRVIFTKHKHLVSGDYLIEDNVENIRRWELNNPGGEGILMQTSYTENAVPTEYLWTWDALAEEMLS